MNCRCDQTEVDPKTNSKRKSVLCVHRNVGRTIGGASNIGGMRTRTCRFYLHGIIVRYNAPKRTQRRVETPA